MKFRVSTMFGWIGVVSSVVAGYSGFLLHICTGDTPTDAMNQILQPAYIVMGCEFALALLSALFWLIAWWAEKEITYTSSAQLK